MLPHRRYGFVPFKKCIVISVPITEPAGQDLILDKQFTMVSTAR